MQDYQDGQTRPGPGGTYTRQGGQWVLTSPAPMTSHAPGFTGPQATARNDAETRTSVANAAAAELRLAHERRQAQAEQTAGSQELTPQAIDMAAHQYILSGAFPPNLGRGGVTQRAILNHVAEIVGARSGENIQVGINRYKNGVHAIQTLENQAGTIATNESTANANAEQFLSAIRRVYPDDSTRLGNTVRAGLRAVFNDPDYAAYETARNTFLTEYAKVVAGTPGGAGTLSDSARREQMDILSNATSPAAAQAAVNQMRLDMRNRSLAYQNNIQRGYQNLETGHPVSFSANAELLDERGNVIPPPRSPAAPAAGMPGVPPIIGGPGGGPGAPPTLGGGPQGGAPGGMDRTSRIAAPPGDVGSIASGGTQTVADPTLAGVNARVDHMLRSGEPDDAIRAYVADVTRAAGGSVPGLDAVLAFRQQNPGYHGSYNPQLENREVPLSAPRQALIAAGSSAPGAYVLGAGNALTAGYMPELAPGNTELNRAGMAGIASAHPVADTVGNMSGGVLASLAPEAAAARWLPGVTAALANAPRIASAARIGGDAAYGAAYGSGMSPDDRLGGALTGSVAGAGGGMFGRQTARALGSIAAPTGGSLAPLYEAGVRPTIGQRLAQAGDAGSLARLGGRVANTTEQLLQSVPVLGVLPARARGIARDQFERGAFNNALEPIGDKLPDNMPLGSQPHAYMQSAFDRAYTNARSGMQMVPDGEWAQDFGGVQRQVGNLSRDSQHAFDNIFTDSVGRRIANNGGALSGDDFVQAQSELGQKIRALNSNPTGDRELAAALSNVSGALDNSAMRNSDPASVQALQDAHRGYAQATRVETAAAMRGGGDSSGRFTPTQYDAAVQKGSGGIRSRAYLRGDALGQDYANAGRSLIDTVPNSGSAERLMQGQLLGGVAGGGLGFLGGGGPALGLSGALSLPYVPGLNKAITSAMAPRDSLLGTKIGDLLRRNAPIGGGMFAPLAVQNTSVNGY